MDKPVLFPCCISVCPPDTSTNFDDALGLKNEPMSERFVVEFGTEHPEILVVPGQTIKIDQIIGYMRGVPVRSKINGTITEVSERYFIGIYDNDINSALLNTDFGNDLSEENIKKILEG